ncbi:TIGR00725 family protein [Thermococcus aggregans]|uniref:TIGR00725 family protein n=1 Tax=Thermococcus aggregans TaxID=110163 RepID=A0A9E7MWS0_THEAG|nr:TIGR00725 family protein [Thermococcus aggregans]USS40305.1 TIGR00725 family protein [Thermococcus aggregans]
MIQIAIAGSSDSEPLPKAVAKTKEFIKELAKYKDNVVLLTGGRGGIMEVASREFTKFGGIVVGILPERQEGNEFNTIRIKTGMDFVERSAVMVNSADVLVVLGGGIGTMVEALMAYDCSKPIIVVTDTGYPSDRLELLAEDGYFDHKKLVKVRFTKDAKEAARLALELAR